MKGREDGAVLVIGAGGGIGGAVARRLHAAGTRVEVAGPASERLDAVARDVDAEPRALDATRFDEVEHAAESAAGRHGRLRGIVNCAGSLLLKPAHITRREEWDEVLALNLTTAFAAVRAAGRFMAEHGGSVALVSSAAAGTGMANHEAIAAAKAGVEGLARAAAATYAPRGIRVNAVAPGLVRTRLTERITSSEAGEKASLSMHALGRLGEPEDVASALVWLLDPANAWVTGQVIGVDGGLARVRTRA